MWRWLQSPLQWKWKWIFWEVVFPLSLPPLLAIIAILLWITGPQKTIPDLRVIFDLPPWTLTFFGITLLASSLRKMALAGRMSTGLFWCLIVLAFLNGLYCAMFIAWRQEQPYNPGLSTYILSVIFTIASIRVCHANAE